MTEADAMRTIESAEATGPARLSLRWSDGTQVEVDLGAWLEEPAFASLREPGEFARVEVGDWGHSLEWPGGTEVGADSLWLETLSTTRREDTRAFLEWRLKHGLSLSGAAAALGLSRRMVAYYSNAEKPVPKTVLLACRGWESSPRSARQPRSPHKGVKPREPALATVAAPGTHPNSMWNSSPSRRQEVPMTRQTLFIERRPEGDYAVRRPNSERASDVLPTQQKAIGRARELDPEATILVERVRHTEHGLPDKWRKP